MLCLGCSGVSVSEEPQDVTDGEADPTAVSYFCCSTHLPLSFSQTNSVFGDIYGGKKHTSGQVGDEGGPENLTLGKSHSWRSPAIYTFRQKLKTEGEMLYSIKTPN